MGGSGGGETEGERTDVDDVGRPRGRRGGGGGGGDSERTRGGPTGDETSLISLSLPLDGWQDSLTTSIVSSSIGVCEDCEGGDRLRSALSRARFLLRVPWSSEKDAEQLRLCDAVYCSGSGERLVCRRRL